MSHSIHKRCPRCEASLCQGDAVCPSCLLRVVLEDDPDQTGDRIFQQALGLDPEARDTFIDAATAGNPALGSDVRRLLAGYEEAGGDTAHPTLSEAPNSRAQWALISQEEPGTVINHFRLIRLLGEGGMGSVWRAEQTAPVHRLVALKIIKLGMDTREVVKRFERERQTLALLNHPNIAQVFEAGATAVGRPYFVMELVEGQPVTTHCQRAGLDVPARLQLFREICAAVEHAHQKGVIHRDLKPSNILVAHGLVKVIDFGVAKATQGAGDLFVTQQMRIVGTPAYMSPEQARSNGVDVDTRTDVYALGVVLYELLTGTLPIDSRRLTDTSLPEMQRIICEEDPPTPSTRVKSLARQGKASPAPVRAPRPLPRDLDRVVMKALRKDRNERYASAAALAEDLRRYLANEPVSAAPPSLAYHAGKFLRRHRLVVAAGAAVITAMLVGLIVSLIQVRRANQALLGEAKARQEVTFTLSDMFTRSGLVAAGNQDPTRAELWFANAAILGAQDPERLATSRLRAAAWRNEGMTAVRAFETGFEHLRQLTWNPHRPALIAQGEEGPPAQIWDLGTEKQWPPAVALASAVGCAAWNPAGDRIALGLTNGPVVVLEFPSGKPLARLAGNHAPSLQWSPDGRWIGVSGFLWDWNSNERIVLPVAAQRVCFNRDGTRMLLQWNSLAGVCAVSDPSRWLHAPVPAHPGDLSCFIGDGQSYVVGNPKGGLTVRDSVTGAILFADTQATDLGYAGAPITVSANGRFIASRGRGVWDLRNSHNAQFPAIRSSFVGADFSPDNSLFACGGYDNRLDLWSVASGKFLGEVGHHHLAVINVAFSPDGKYVASGEDGLVRVWRVQRPQWAQDISADAPTLAVMSPDGTFVAAAGLANQAGAVKHTQLIDLATSRPAGPKIAPGGLLMDAAFSPDGTRLALAVSTTADRSDPGFQRSAGSGNIQLWNPRTGERLGDPIPMPSEPRGVCWHPSGKFLGVCCADGEGVEMDLAGRAPQTLFNDHRRMWADATLNEGRCAYSPDGRVFVAWGFFQSFHLWDREKRRDLIEPYQRQTTTFDVAFHDNIVARAVVASTMRVEFYDLHTGREAAPTIPYINWPFLTRFSDDGKLLLTAGGGKSAQVWDWRHGRLVCPVLPHDDIMMAGCFVPGTPWVITGGHDGQIKFWDRRTGMMIRPPWPGDGMVLELQTTPDGRALVASGWLPNHYEIIRLPEALPAPDLPPEDARLLAEIDADAELFPGGGLAPLTPQDWLKKWQEFRDRHPDYPGHRLDGF